MRRTDPGDWMWAQACDVLDEAERMHRRFFRLAPSTAAQAAWEPPVDMFEGERETMDGGPREVGGGHELSECGGSVLENSEDCGGLVNDANAAMIVHRAILASHMVRCLG